MRKTLNIPPRHGMSETSLKSGFTLYTENGRQEIPRKRWPLHQLVLERLVLQQWLHDLRKMMDRHS